MIPGKSPCVGIHPPRSAPHPRLAHRPLAEIACGLDLAPPFIPCRLRKKCRDPGRGNEARNPCRGLPGRANKPPRGSVTTRKRFCLIGFLRVLAGASSETAMNPKDRRPIHGGPGTRRRGARCRVKTPRGAWGFSLAVICFDSAVENGCWGRIHPPWGSRFVDVSVLCGDLSSHGVKSRRLDSRRGRHDLLFRAQGGTSWPGAPSGGSGGEGASLKEGLCRA